MQKTQVGIDPMFIYPSPFANPCVTIAPNALDREATMRAGLVAAIVAASAFGGSAAGAACPAGARGHCVDLDLVPQISQQIVATEPIVAPRKAVPTVEPQPGYTGPTIGAAKNLRRAPEVGYRWSIN
jgi:hypothetical protein